MKMHVTGRCNVRKMRDAEHLKSLADPAALLADHAGHPPAKAGVDLVENERLPWCIRGRECSDGQHHARQLTATRDSRKRTRILAHVCRHVTFSNVDTVLGPRGL